MNAAEQKNLGKQRKAIIFYGGFRSRSGGVFTHVTSLQSELSARGWNVQVVTLDSLPAFVRYLPHVIEKGINVFRVPLGFYYKGRVTRVLYRLFFAQPADLYVFEDIYLSWNVQAPALTMLHAIWSDNLQAFDLKKGQIRRLIRKEAEAIELISHPVATVSAPYHDYLTNTHFFEAKLHKKIEVIELGLELEYFSHAFSMCRSRSIVFCGALEARKNVLFMIDVFERVLAGDALARLTLIGDGPELGLLRRLSKQRNLNVNFLGRLPHKDVIAELSNHSIYLHTSLKESFSFSLLEAKLCGLRTFALGSLQVPEVFIDFKFNAFDAAEWAKAILEINFEDNRSGLPDFSLRRMVNRTLSLAK